MTAIATLTQRAETAQTGSVHEWRGPPKEASPDLIDYIHLDESIEEGCYRHRIARKVHGEAVKRGQRRAARERATCFRASRHALLRGHGPTGFNQAQIR